MSSFESGKTKRESCPGCGNLLKEDTKFCPNCTLNIQEHRKSINFPAKSSGSISQQAIRSVQAVAGLNTWRRPPGQIAICAEIENFRMGFLNFKKGLIVRPGTRAILVKDGQLLEALGPGNYSISDCGLNASIFSRVANYFTGSSRCEIYLVDDGEFKVSMGGKALEEEESEDSQKNSVVHLNVDRFVEEFFSEIFKGSEPFLSSLSDEEFSSISDDIKQKILKSLENTLRDRLNKHKTKMIENLDQHGFEEKFSYLEGHRDLLERMKKDGIKDEDIDRLDKYLLNRQAKLIRHGERWLSEALESTGLLRLKTTEGYEIELSVDLFFRVEGNLEFVNNVLRGRAVLCEQDLRGCIKTKLLIFIV